jgi:hypothetical protein
MAATKISICSTAAVMVGDEPISAIPGASRASIVCDQVYENTVRQQLALYPWKFAKAQATLSKLVATPLFREYKNAFQLPAGFQRVIRTEFKTDYRIHQDLLYSNEDSINLEFCFRPGEADWPYYFVRVAELKMSYILSLSLAEDNTKARMFDEEYREALMQAKSIDSQDQPPSRIKADILIKARHSSYDEGW